MLNVTPQASVTGEPTHKLSLYLTPWDPFLFPLQLTNLVHYWKSAECDTGLDTHSHPTLSICATIDCKSWPSMKGLLTYMCAQTVMIHDTRLGDWSCDGSGDLSPDFSEFVYVWSHVPFWKLYIVLTLRELTSLSQNINFNSPGILDEAMTWWLGGQHISWAQVRATWDLFLCPGGPVITQTPDMKLSWEWRSLCWALPMFVSLFLYPSALPLHLIVCNLVVTASAFHTHTIFNHLLINSTQECQY